VTLAVQRMRDCLGKRLWVADLAAAVGMAPWSFTRLFRAHTGESPQKGDPRIDLSSLRCRPTYALGGSPVVVQLQVEDVDVAFERMVAAGAVVVFPLVNFCGDRMGRLRDPFGHLWLISQRVEELSAGEVQRRRDVWSPTGEAAKTG
jgi:hypothetical protein